MGFQDVYELHGVGERGKDIVCWKNDVLGHPENYALVVKATGISGAAASGKGTAAEIQTQMHQCFGAPYENPRTGKHETVNKCWIVSNKKISSSARPSIKSALTSDAHRNAVSIIDIDELWE